MRRNPAGDADALKVRPEYRPPERDPAAAAEPARQANLIVGTWGGDYRNLLQEHGAVSQSRAV